MPNVSQNGTQPTGSVSNHLTAIDAHAGGGGRCVVLAHVDRARFARLITARRDRTPLFVSGDLHALAAGRILATRGQSLERNPVVSVLCGAIGTGAFGWPSKFRDQRPVPSGTLEAEEWVEPLEENGFSLLDVTPDAVKVSMFCWTPDDGEEAIDRLEPFKVVDVPRPGRA